MSTCKKLASAEGSQSDLRARFIAACKALDRARTAARAAGLDEGMAGWPRPDFSPFAGLRCGAKGKRTGLPCPLTGIYGNGRCRFHGGLSTGPKTPAGRVQAAINGCKPKRTP